jgi:hypothetical protein
LQEVAYEEPPRIHGTLFSGVGFCSPRVLPNDSDLRRAADILNAGKKVARLSVQARCRRRPKYSRFPTLSARAVAKRTLELSECLWTALEHHYCGFRNNCSAKFKSFKISNQTQKRTYWL